MGVGVNTSGRNVRSCQLREKYAFSQNLYYMAESIFAMRLVNLRSVTCYTDQNLKENVHFGALNLFTSEKKVEIKLQDVYQP